MKILADSNMPFVREAFSRLGETVLKDGRTFTAADARDADMVICRSTAKIGPALLEGSKVRFVGSGVIGTDHLDIPWLESQGIRWRSAPGCNARSVANWAASALQALRLPRGATLGIVGCGHVGSQVEIYAKAAGLRTVLNDPPKGVGVPLEELLQVSDAVTLHVPLVRTGKWPTFHLADERFFSLMNPGAVFLNAARGAVADTDAFIAAKRSGRISAAAIDCWEGEPHVRKDAIDAADIATPHIAGHSFEGKVNGTATVYREACAFLGIEPDFDFPLPPPPEGFFYDIMADDAAFRAAPESFDRLRAAYPTSRRELPPEAFARPAVG